MGCLYGLQIVPLPRLSSLLHRGLARATAAASARLPLAEFLPLASSPAETAAHGATFMITGSSRALRPPSCARTDANSLPPARIGILCIISGLLWGFSCAPWMNK